MSLESMSRPLLRTSTSSLDNSMEHHNGNMGRNGSANLYNNERSYREPGLASQLYAPASEWYETMQWSRGSEGASARRRLQLVSVVVRDQWRQFDHSLTLLDDYDAATSIPRSSAMLLTGSSPSYLLAS